ncbi:MAG: type III secretion system chaperone [Alphaproteobacteria bacterium]|nr:type III secretion system chaperone [Alphaproteobacteria bacterium]
MAGPAELSQADAVEGVLAALSEVLGHTVALDASGQCTLAFADGIEITLAAAPEADGLTARSEIMRPEAGDALPLRAALAANYGRLPPGVSLALDGSSGRLVLHCFLPLAEATGTDLIALVANFVGLVPELRNELMPDPIRTDDQFDGRRGTMIRG